VYFFATGRVTQPAEIGRYREEEKRVLAELREQGVVREAFSPAAGHGVISILEGSSLEDVQAQLARLPFVAHGLLVFEYTEVVPL
jgi:uncharacterized protein YciI